MKFVRSPENPLTADEIVAAAIEVVRREGGVMWLDKAIVFVVRQEGVGALRTRAAISSALLWPEQSGLERVLGNESWYPSTLRLTGETRRKPEDPRGTEEDDQR